MSFITEIIDAYLEDFGGSLSYFDRDGNAHSIQRNSGKSSYPSYEDFYLAMGAKISKEVQSKYTKIFRFWVFWEAIQTPSLLFSLLIGVVSMILAFITKGEGWPEEIVTLAIVFGMGPLIGYMGYNWFFESEVSTYFENAYNRELAQKRSNLTIQKVKRELNWAWIAAVILAVALGFLESWQSVVGILLFVLLCMLLGMVEGLLFIGVGKLKVLFFTKNKKESASPQPTLSPELLTQIKQYFKLLYHDFEKGEYATAFDRFGHSQKTKEEFHLEIQHFLDEDDLTSFHLEPFSEAETSLSILDVTQSNFEVTLFLHDLKAEEFPIFYLVCKASYKDNKIQAIELVEVGY